jgi:hypothetical protein
MSRIKENLKRYQSIEAIHKPFTEVFKDETCWQALPHKWQMISQVNSNTKQTIQLMWSRASELGLVVQTLIDNVEDIGFMFDANSNKSIGLTYSWNSGKKAWLAKPPALSRHIHEAENRLGIQFPYTLTSLLACHDGIYFSGLTGLRISSSLEIELLSNIDSDAVYKNEELELGANKFIAIAHDGIGNLLCLTTAKQVEGQVFDWDHEARTINQVGRLDHAISKFLIRQNWMGGNLNDKVSDLHIANS